MTPEMPEVLADRTGRHGGYYVPECPWCRGGHDFPRSPEWALGPVRPPCEPDRPYRLVLEKRRQPKPRRPRRSSLSRAR